MDPIQKALLVRAMLMQLLCDSTDVALVATTLKTFHITGKELVDVVASMVGGVGVHVRGARPLAKW